MAPADTPNLHGKGYTDVHNNKKEMTKDNTLEGYDFCLHFTPV